MSNDSGKIIDEDWKSRAQREKEEAARQSRPAEDASKSRSRRAGGFPPEVRLEAIVESLALQAVAAMGLMADPHTGQAPPPDLTAAQYYIDLVQLIQEKTRGNLTPQENTFLTNTLDDLRLAFVRVGKSSVGPRSPVGPR